MDGKSPKRPHPFSIASLLSTIRPPPPKRSFLVENLIENEQHAQSGSGSSSSTTKSKTVTDYVKKLNSVVEQNARFKYGKIKSRFSITALPDDPEGLLTGIFEYCIAEAKATNRQRVGEEPDHLGCVINSALLDTPVWTKVRPINENTTDAILNQFLKVAQSKKQDGITLWGEPFSVTVTTVNRVELPEERQIVGGSNRRLAPVHHRISDRSLIKIDNPDGRCLFYALQATLMHNVAGMPRQRFADYLHHGQRGRFNKHVDQLLQAIGVPPNLAAYNAPEYVPKVIDYWNNSADFAYAGKFKFKCFIFDSTGHYKPIYKYGPEDGQYDVPIILYFTGAHFHGIQKSGNLFGKPYCLSCECCYTHASFHKAKCKSRCIKCSRIGPSYPCKPFLDYKEKCLGCNKVFFSKDCFRSHKQSRFCDKSKQCDICNVIYDVHNNTQNGRKGHVCDERWCQKCNDYHDRQRGCYIQPLDPKPPKRPCRFVAFDMETTQHEPADPSSPAAQQDKRMHVPNFISAKVSCAECISSGEWKNTLRGDYQCQVCGDNRTIAFSQRPFNDTKVDKQIIDTHPLVKFVKWILYELPRKYDTYAYSHYGGKFDNVIVFKELYMEKLNPQMIRQGNKLFQLKVKQRKGRNPNVIFRDSFNLMPMALAKLVPTFGLNVEDKPFFPHLANRPENYGKPILLNESDYLAEGMMPATRAKFDTWFSQHKDEPFLLDEALASYCTNDVEILMAAMVAFRGEFLEVTKRPAVTPDGKADRPCFKSPHNGIDVLRECMTIASACMRHFRTNHLDSRKLGLVSDRGYDFSDNQSLLAMRFMNWYGREKKVDIQNADSEEREKKIGDYKLDGWIEAGADSYGLEINGCVVHACPKCYPNDQQKMPTGLLAGVKRELDKQRVEFIRSKVPHLEIYWECEINKMLKADPKDKDFMRQCSVRLGFEFDPAVMKQHFNALPDRFGSINLRSAFMGGRTGPLKVHHAVQPGEKISYYDVTSLYPFTNFITPYPMGHPKVHVINEEVNWRSAADNPYEVAIIKAFVIPPRNLDLPVLPMRIDERLLFPLCGHCALKYSEGAVKAHYSCNHNDNARGWVTTCTSYELDEALDAGYRVTELYRVLEYEESDSKIFQPYIREFMKQKIEASGFEKGIEGDPQAEAKFIQDCKDKFGFDIDPSKMVRNEGKRAVAKLALNSFWGKFSMKNEMSESLIIDDPAELGRLLDDCSIDVDSIDELTPETLLVCISKRKEWIEEHAASNIVISIFTTSVARILLYRAMKKVSQTPGCQILYTDTDSIIFVHPEGNNPLELGPHLGDFTDEYPEHDIIEFVSGGCKQYGLKLRKKGAPDAEFEYCLKIRGMTLNHSVVENQGLKYETFRNKVLAFARTGEPQSLNIVYPNFLCPSLKTGSVLSVPRIKMYRPFVAKGIVDPVTLHVLDFGHIVIKNEPDDH